MRTRQASELPGKATAQISGRRTGAVTHVRAARTVNGTPEHACVRAAEERGGSEYTAGLPQPRLPHKAHCTTFATPDLRLEEGHKYKL